MKGYTKMKKLGEPIVQGKKVMLVSSYPISEGSDVTLFLAELVEDTGFTEVKILFNCEALMEVDDLDTWHNGITEGMAQSMADDLVAGASK